MSAVPKCTPKRYAANYIPPGVVTQAFFPACEHILVKVPAMGVGWFTGLSHSSRACEIDSELPAVKATSRWREEGAKWTR